VKPLSRVAGFLAAHWPVLALVAVLTLSAIIVSSRKPFWNDELFSWYFVTADFGTLWRAFHDALNNSPFLYFGLGWLWVHVFGASELSLRLFSSLGISLAALALWPLLHRVYGFWPATLGLLATFCTSALVLDQNAEARMYGLLLALIALAVPLYDRLLRAGRYTPAVLVLNGLVHAAIVHTHLFGPFYSGTIAMAFAASPLLGGFGWRRLLAPWPVYLSFLAAWLSFLLYLPAFHLQAEAGRPYSWIAQPALADLTALLFHASGAFLRPEIFVQLIAAAALVWLLAPPAEPTGAAPAPPRPDDRHLLLLALALLALPVAVWIASRLARPIFLDRYLIPSMLGWTLLIAHAAARLLPGLPTSGWQQRAARGLLLGLLALGLLAYPVLEARAYYRQSLPGSEDHLFGHADLPLVMQTSHGFLERVHYAPDAERYFYVLDWDAANRPESGRFGIQQHKHMEAWRRVLPEVFADRILDSDVFLAAHEEFLVLIYPDYDRSCSPEGRGHRMHCPQWLPKRLAGNPAFALTEIFSGPGYVVLHVRRRAAAMPP